MPGTSDLLGGLEDLSSLRGLAALEDSAGAGAAQRVGE